MSDISVARQTTKASVNAAIRVFEPAVASPTPISAVMAALGFERTRKAFAPAPGASPTAPRFAAAGSHHMPFGWPSLPQSLLAGSCALGVWVGARLARLLPVWTGPAATVLALFVGVAYLASANAGLSDVSPRPPRRRDTDMTSMCGDAAPTALDDGLLWAGSDASSQASSASGASAKSSDSVSNADSYIALGTDAWSEQLRAAPLTALVAARLEADIDLLYRVSAWAQAIDVAAGLPRALAYQPVGFGNDARAQRAQAHLQQVILTASLESFRRMTPSRRNTFSEQLTLLVERHAACVDDCYALLARPDEADEIARRIVCPTDAWTEHEAALERLTDGGTYGDIDERTLSRLYEAPPERYHVALDVQPETIAAYHKAEAARLAAQMVGIFSEVENDLRAGVDMVDVPDDAGRVDAWLHAIDAHDHRQAWHPFFDEGYHSIGEFNVGETPPAALSSDDFIGRLEARKARLLLRDAAEAREIEDFAQQLFADPNDVTNRMPNSLQRDNEGCVVQAFILANMQHLPGAPSAHRGRSHTHAPSRPQRTSAQLKSSSQDVERLARACDESYAMLEDCERHRAVLARALDKPNTSSRHADWAERLTRLTTWGNQEVERYEKLSQDLRLATWHVGKDASL